MLEIFLWKLASQGLCEASLDLVTPFTGHSVCLQLT